MTRTAEFVSPMHPDKLCDQISDAILDECLKQDSDARVAVEVMGGHGIITVTGEVTTKAYVDVKKCVESVVGSKYGVQVNLVHQSPEIAAGVDGGGAGDQGIMVGYACRDTKNLMPLEYEAARSLCKHVYGFHHADGKTQITTIDGVINTILVSWNGLENVSIRDVITNWMELCVALELFEFDENVNILVNPAGDWSIGGFDADTGVTGRKIVVDAYGPRVQVGGGAYSGKDPSKVDRSAAYMARKIAVDILNKNKDINECRVEIAYAIGIKDPVMVVVFLDGVFTRLDHCDYDLSPKSIINLLDLKKPIYQRTAMWGHYGNNNKWDI